MANKMKLLLPFILILVSACNYDSRGQEAQSEEVIRAEASAFLDILRAGKWDDAVPLVSLDDVTRSRMGIPENAADELIKSKVQEWFQTLYEKIRPGSVHSVRIDPNDPDLALISYRHGDIDGFNMRFVGNRWLYTLEWEPRNTAR